MISQLLWRTKHEKPKAIKSKLNTHSTQ